MISQGKNPDIYVEPEPIIKLSSALSSKYTSLLNSNKMADLMSTGDNLLNDDLIVSYWVNCMPDWVSICSTEINYPSEEVLTLVRIFDDKYDVFYVLLSDDLILPMLIHHQNVFDISKVVVSNMC